jgi:hypothetical protein
MVREQKDHINDLNRKNLSLEESIDLLNQRKGILEREVDSNKKQIIESAKLVQDNEKVSPLFSSLPLLISAGHQPSQRIAHRLSTWGHWPRVRNTECWLRWRDRKAPWRGLWHPRNVLLL